MRKKFTILSRKSSLTSSIDKRAPRASTIASPFVSGKYTLTDRAKRFLGMRIAEKLEPSLRMPNARKSSYL